ncbi:MAG: hypothetical protein GX468_06480, partial [Thermotogaceae bacterium]|nr:hypothetical protein [Thermotogaceae bacterium]
MADFIKQLSDSQTINESIKIKFCEENTVKSSKYGTFKYGQRKYGKNVTICEERLKAEIGQILVKINDGYLLPFGDEIDFSDSLERKVEYHLSLSDSQPISENLEKECYFFVFL